MSSASSLVVGGTLSTQDQFPWLVAVFKKKYVKFQHSAAGSLVSNRHVVTKATAVGYYNGDTKKFHAVRLNSLRLYLGMTKFESDEEPDEDGLVFVNGVENIEIHPDAEGGSQLVFNIAVVTMTDAVTFSSFVYPVCLWDFEVSIDNQVGQVAYGVGYGRDESEMISGEKKHVPMTINDMKRCEKFWDEELDAGAASEYFCASGKVGNVAYNFDDPLYLKEDGRWYLRGLYVSYFSLNSHGSIDARKPILYENTGIFLTWIQEQVDNTQE